jgi:hypothetical protein
VAGSRSLARRRGARVETTGGGSAVQTSERNMSILACASSSGLGAAAGGGGEGGAGDKDGVIGGEGARGRSWAVRATPIIATGRGNTSSKDIGSQTRGEGTNTNGEPRLELASRTIGSQSRDQATEGARRDNKIRLQHMLLRQW